MNLYSSVRGLPYRTLEDMRDVLLRESNIGILNFQAQNFRFAGASITVLPPEPVYLIALLMRLSTMEARITLSS